MAVFELRHGDVAGRVGELHLPAYDRPVPTPALLPVINPNLDTITAPDLVEEFAPAGLITNAYVIYRHDDLRERALSEGVHGLLGVDCPVMTDSGSFQLAEYGEIEVSNDEIVAFQSAIGSDICTPIDIPTPPDAGPDTAAADLETTLARIVEAADHVEGPRLLSGPVQGSTHEALRERAGRSVRDTGADVFPIGAVVPLMTDYRFADLVDVVVAAKRGLGPDAPVHLFGAGHPMMFALAAVLGCDLLDSAAYALYARDDRYLTVEGTRRLDELAALPCACPVCSSHSVDDLTDAGDATRERLLARHNLHVSFAELRRIRHAITAGTLLELVERRARAHPAMLDAYRRLLDHAAFLDRHDPAVKDTFLYLSSESARRPEVTRHHDRLRSWSITGRVLVGRGVDADPYDHVMGMVPPFGPVPAGLAHTYPLTAEVPSRLDAAAYDAAAAGVAALAEGSPEAAIDVVTTGWPAGARAALPGAVTAIDPDRCVGADEPVY